MTAARSGLWTPLCGLLGAAMTLGCGPGSSTGPALDGGDPGRDAEIATDAGAGDAASDGPTDAGAGPPISSFAVIHARHRAIPGVMFGGWGPHLGHLLRRRTGSGEDDLWFVDDACAPGACSVDRDTTLAVLRLGDDGWTLVEEVALPAGIQQNTASVLVGETVRTIGVDVRTIAGVAPALVECRRELPSGGTACATLDLDVGSSANYVGAAASPDGWVMAWLTNVGNGIGGQFRHYEDYGLGWNGPRTGGIGGYGDASYIHAAFGVGGEARRFVMLGQLVSGVAPNWSTRAGLAWGDASDGQPVTWSTPFAEAGPDAALSTDDVLVATASADVHILVRTASAAAAYFFQADGGALEGPLAVIPGAYRARLVELDDGSIVLVHGVADAGLAVRRAAVVAGVPIDWNALEPWPVPLPDGYEDVYAIYTEALPAPRTNPKRLDVAIVGAAREHEVLHVRVEWPARGE